MHAPALSAPVAPSGEATFLANLTVVHDVIRRVCRRYRMTPEDQEEFTSAVVLRFIENNYEVFRRFRGDCSLRAFLATVVMRYLFESRDQAWGRWRPSKCARRLGSAAVYLETLVHRDRTPLPEAIALVSNHPRWALSTGAVRALYAQLPERPPRCRRVAQLDTAVHRVSNGDLTPAELDERRRETGPAAHGARRGAQCARPQRAPTASAALRGTPVDPGDCQNGECRRARALSTRVAYSQAAPHRVAGAGGHEPRRRPPARACRERARFAARRKDR